MGFTPTPKAEPKVSTASLPLLDLTDPNYRATRVWTVDEAAFHTGISRATIYRMVRRGDLPAWRDPETGSIRLLEAATRLALKGLRK
jgi:excisionase family DNA binding protein